MQSLEKLKSAKFQRNLFRWFEGNGRLFPWRQTQEPYRVIVAEFLLQKTNVEKVLLVYGNFIKRYPTVEILADAPIQEITEFIRPLGLLYRAGRMKKMADSIVSNYGGVFPSNKKLLRSLDGVGDYIANALLTFAFGQRVPIVDTNIVRIFDRIFGIKSDRSRARTDRRFWELVGTVVPKKHPREYNFALLDFAALICTAQDPSCPTCPMRNFCNYKRAMISLGFHCKPFK